MNPLSFEKSAAGTPAAVSPQKLINRIEYWLQLASNREYIDGCLWYAEANKFCHTVAIELGLHTAHVAQALAILSPQVDWETNKRNLVLLATTQDPEITIFASRGQKVKALAALFGEYQIPETSRKIWSFADNIGNPESTRVTVDRHAVKAALNDRSADPIRITTARYKQIEEAYRQVARKHHLLPYQLQAIVWVTYKRVVGR